MNFLPNKTEWKVGDLVLHDMDRKSPELFLVVCGYRRDGKVKCRYVFHEKWGKTYRFMDLKNLHNPNRFGINLLPTGPCKPKEKYADKMTPEEVRMYEIKSS